MNKSEKDTAGRNIYRPLFVALLSVVLLAATLLLYSYYVNRNEARTILQQAKLTKLSFMATSSKYYGLNKVILDSTTETGITDEAYKEIMKTALTLGDFRLISTNDGYTIKEMCYTYGDYTAVYRLESGVDTWYVYKFKEIIKP